MLISFGAFFRETWERKLAQAEAALAEERAARQALEAELARRPHGAARPGVPDAAALPVIHVRCMGNLANRMIQYMAALALQARVPHARLSGIRLPEWGIEMPELAFAEPAFRIPDHRIDLAAAARLLADGTVPSVVLLNYLQNVANLLPPDLYRSVFPKKGPPSFVVGNDELLISLRMEEVLSGFYPFYTLLPVAFYREVVARTGLAPVFFGQLTPSAYLDALRAAFPEARFIAGTSPLADFETLRAAPNLCLSVSTFAWAAAFLGDAKRIVFPASGLLNPGTCAALGDDIDLVPRLDARLEPWFFPVNYAVCGDDALAVHAELEGRWREAGRAECAALLAGEARAPRPIHDYLPLFDEAFYLRAHPEIAAAVADGRMASGEAHFHLHGFDENRACFALDARFYARSHPDAADAVGFGRYRDFHHFHASRGARLGYVPVAPESRAA